MVDFALQAAEQLSEDGISVEIVDPRSLSPLDEDAILGSLEKTGRLVVVDESTPRCSFATDVAALAADRGFDLLDAPIKRVTAPHSPVPFSPTLEDAYIPSPAHVIDAVREILD
jgi:pyruvate dehydrogenase E1 component beta subunit